MIGRPVGTGSGLSVFEVQRWPDYWYMLAFVLSMAIVGAVFLLFMGKGWGLFQVPALVWPQLNLLSLGRAAG